ncbi:uncharacterized protein RHIMIDRAFT_7510 [Rhizopus microsporus ATCC 52813]|uniref:O-fucosyltransferase family protein n=1 Tax=Rhizopus microsporus ATCC 52813 TaxID=1340429 RepID=A0A2G4T8U2_RHIZD|nr:uncharacterized protein RHIMIDRAFT_7510 [Rhizopus microsporus ATCC 52813]PHZ17433.1 hypothetical protein RHIMIDRAFT_7510 [Rhizopus microsporus ATCC 52813]
MLLTRIVNKPQSVHGLIRFTKSKAFILFILASFFLLSHIIIHFRLKLHYSSATATVIGTTITTNQSQQDRYLAYLPHSGLSNQRIELANALLLAYMLKRTLLIPPAFLGNVFGWMPREQLMDHLQWLTTPKPFTKLCQRPTPGKIATYVQRSRCEEYRNFGVLSWSDLHDLSPLTPYIQYRFQDVMSLETIQKQFNLSRDDIYLYEDAQLYDWRLYENMTQATEILDEHSNYVDSFGGRRYYKVLLPQHLYREEKLLFLGGVFGSTRLNIVDPELKTVHQKITHALHYRLDTPLGMTVQSIVDHLGGKGSFMSVHFRTGDKPFKKELPTNLQNFVKNMTEIVGSHETDNCVDIPLDSDQMTVGKKVKVYIATDHKNPKGKGSDLLPWFREFPCTVTLGDLPGHLLSPLDDLRDMVSPSKSLKRFLIPLVDAMVAAHGRGILTTPRSTFSKYIEELHKAWVPQ